MMNIVLSIMVLAAFGLLAGAFALWKRGGPIKQVLMMVLLAVIAVVNVAIWTIPDAEGTSPLDKIEQVEEPASSS
ncbi:hypothetical protein HKD42_02200 [Altererythrobacter sp. RZ02]|uniref:Uncharacterized protein n=1 Tax=Pontixanthobacter rizhaonensis TaxID=2730337 RepID=A0A848QJC9_9SPHN|nr:hypothetical protein [Pontixanthobacter rizhaonensis]NMW30869.1 hypothetical protein [Pontixanthobacter rizhaonensis]